MNYTKILLTSALLVTGLVQSNAATITLAGDPIQGGLLTANSFTVAGIGQSGNNSPGEGESASSAIDASIGSKYLNFAELNTGYIVVPAIGSSVITGIDFVTGNDAPERDPASYSLYGSNALTTLSLNGPYNLVTDVFTLISTGPLALPTTGPNLTGENIGANGGRGLTSSISFTNSVDYKSYILVFPTVRDSGSANSMQIAGAVLTGVPEPGSLAFLGLGAIGMLSRRRRTS